MFNQNTNKILMCLLSQPTIGENQKAFLICLFFHYIPRKKGFNYLES